MIRWLVRCGLFYRRLSRAFPHDFRIICGDGLEHLGTDAVPLVWRDRGLGLARCSADLNRPLARGIS